MDVKPTAPALEGLVRAAREWGCGPPMARISGPADGGVEPCNSSEPVARTFPSAFTDE